MIILKKYLLALILLGSLLSQDIIGEGLYEIELIEYLRANYKTSTTLGYTDARDTLYLNIDRIDGKVSCVYTNFSVELPPSGVDPSTHLYENGINCEHIWPQSLYEGTEPYKSDMHAIRPCKDNVNSARGNKPYNEVIDTDAITWYWQNNQISNIPSSNIDEYSENYTYSFEPREDKKGDIARTIFYFYTMYSDVADDNFFEIQKDILKHWHEQDLPNEEEINRTWAIAYYQNNKPNPFILDETLIERAYYYDESLIGDLNLDSQLNILDLVALVNLILYDDYTSTADFNNDGATNILDVIILSDIILF